MSEKDKQTDIKTRIQGALEKTDIPKIHFNGFVNSLGIGDVVMVLESNGKPVAVLNASYTVAKTFGQKLTGLIHNLESKSENTIMTTDEVEFVLSKGEGNGSK